MVTAGDPGTVVATARRIVREIDPEVAPRSRRLGEIYADSLAARRFQILLLGIFGATALLLAVVGIYGVVSFQVARRTREIGVRIALGATGDNVVRLIARRGLLLVGLGLALGLAGALAGTRLMQSLLYGVTTSDPVTFLAVPLLLALVALLACVPPALRAARIDPMLALRAE
jgi:putative ABC transport system permease protein